MSLKNRFFTEFPRAPRHTYDAFERIVWLEELGVENERWFAFVAVGTMIGLPALAALAGDTQYAANVATAAGTMMGLVWLVWQVVEARRGR